MDSGIVAGADEGPAPEPPPTPVVLVGAPGPGRVASKLVISVWSSFRYFSLEAGLSLELARL